MTRTRRYLVAPLALTLLSLSLSGCITTTPDPVTGRYTAPIGGAPVISNETPYSAALSCLGNYNSGKPVPRIAVGQIADYTGKEEADGSGRKITQGASLMAISALSRAGVRLVERFDTSVAELELKYANNKLIGGDPNNDPYRKILAGSIPGSDYYLVGGITELNFNIRSEGGEGDYGKTNSPFQASLAPQAYVMNVGLDLRLVDTKTLEVVDVISYQKQIVARQIQAGVFDVLGQSIFNVSAGDSALEPIQLAVRSVIERAVLEMVSRLYQVGPDVCSGGPGSDPLGEPDNGPAYVNPPQADIAPASSQTAADYPVAPAHPVPHPAAVAQISASKPVKPKAKPEMTPDQARQDPYRWYSADNSGQSGLRGGVQ